MYRLYREADLAVRQRKRVKRLATQRVPLQMAQTGHIHGGPKAANKTAFVAAVQTSVDGSPLYMRLTPVADFTNEHMRQWASRHLAAGCHVVSDGTLPLPRCASQAQATHERSMTGGGRQGAQTPQLRWVNTLLGNLKTSTAGTYHSFDHTRYAQRYLAEFCWRFNRR
ncbi:IS1595 family transposase [Acidovorax sp. SD340]|nr:IS1595 family transposase [Acidovorax sp. SD340]